VSTDGFLRANADLDADGLTLRKGFPESYDLAALRRFHRRLRAGDAQIEVPVYAHDIYDVAAEPTLLDRPEVLVLEGVNALQGASDGGEGPGDLADVTVYIDVDEDTVIDWFSERFVTLTHEARRDPDSFYRAWSDLPDHEVRQVAREVWDAINGVNLRDHIEPSRSRADIEVVKAPSHTIVQLRLHPA
jgi:type I pantothenate kinase